MLRRHFNPLKEGQEGKPDRLILGGNGRHFWIEFKKEDTGRMRAMQKVWRKYLSSIGDKILIIDTYQQLLDYLDEWEMIYGPATAKRPA